MFLVFVASNASILKSAKKSVKNEHFTHFYKSFRILRLKRRNLLKNL